MISRHSKVLIADDSSAVHQLIGNALPDNYSVSIVHAFDGLECLNALDEGVDLAFIDVHMPTMGGMDAVWAARIAGNKTFVALISGRANKRCKGNFGTACSSGTSTSTRSILCTCQCSSRRS